METSLRAEWATLYKYSFTLLFFIGRARKQSRNFARKLDPPLYFQWYSSGGSRPPPIFRPNLGPKSRKKADRAPALSQSLDDRPFYLKAWIPSEE